MMIGWSELAGESQRVWTSGHSLFRLPQPIAPTKPGLAVARQSVIGSLLEMYRIEEKLAEPPPAQFGIVDDVLTTGCHIKVMQTILGKRFVGAQIVGIFVARRIFPR